MQQPGTAPRRHSRNMRKRASALVEMVSNPWTSPPISQRQVQGFSAPSGSHTTTHTTSALYLLQVAVRLFKQSIPDPRSVWKLRKILQRPCTHAHKCEPMTEL
jgi:hypothetical protein